MFTKPLLGVREAQRTVLGCEGMVDVVDILRTRAVRKRRVWHHACATVYYKTDLQRMVEAFGEIF